jgi:Tfp pilus assembly protein PilZ
LKKKRRYPRFIRRLETEFSAKNQHYRGISSNFSLGGVFVRTNHAFETGTVLDLKVHLPDGKISELKGCVKVAFRTPGVPLKNGMGVELTGIDDTYRNFVKIASSGEESETEETGASSMEPDLPETPSSPEIHGYILLKCPECGIRNKISQSKKSMRFKCGKCGIPLNVL